MSGLRARISGRRRGVSLSAAESVRESRIKPLQKLPLVLEPVGDDVNLIAWVKGRREQIEELLLANGGILFRGFRLGGPAELERFVRELSDEVLDYTYRSTPRSEVTGKIYTSTEYPADQSIPMHNEMSYSRSWPRKIWFYAADVAETGGATPIADSRQVYQQIDKSIRDNFNAKGVLYVRNYGRHLDLPWQNVFQTEDRSEVEAFCHKAGIELEWRGRSQLRTRQLCQATATHPQTGEDLWFNQAHLFHVSSLDRETRELLLQELGEEGLPRNSYYGDGSPIEVEVIRDILEVYRRNAVTFAWRRGDTLMLDNMLIAHGREPFSGQRKVVVGMADAWTKDSLLAPRAQRRA